MVGIVMAFVQPQRMGLEEWLFIWLRYAAVPKRTVWRPQVPLRVRSTKRAATWIDFSEVAQPQHSLAPPEAGAGRLARPHEEVD